MAHARFIDLLFRHEDRYYILDWKPTVLAPTMPPTRRSAYAA